MASQKKSVTHSALTLQQYEESKSQQKQRHSSYGSESTSQAGPAWLYHFPQQSQFNTPYSSLQYEDIEPSKGVPVMPATMKLNLGEDPVQMTCPYCHEVIVTVIEEEVGLLACCVSTVLCLLLCWPCAFLPCCLSTFKDVTHTCPNCKRFLDTFRRTKL